MERIAISETSYAATLAKLDQLAKDADAKSNEAFRAPDSDPFRGENAAYWNGVRVGILRAKNVIQGNG